MPVKSLNLSEETWAALDVRAAEEVRSRSSLVELLLRRSLGTGLAGRDGSSAAGAASGAAVVGTARAMPEAEESPPSRPASPAAAAEVVNELLALPGVTVASEVGTSRRARSGGSKGRDVTGAMSGLCVHRVSLGSFCQACEDGV